jgi:hypothetical protein
MVTNYLLYTAHAEKFDTGLYEAVRDLNGAFHPGPPRPVRDSFATWAARR